MAELPEAKLATVACPQAGDVDALPYVTFGAATSYQRYADDPDRALRAMLCEVVPRWPEVEPKAGEGDLRVLAGFYAHTLETAGIFTEHVDRLGAAVAFNRAFLQSATWKDLTRPVRSGLLGATTHSLSGLLQTSSALGSQIAKAFEAIKPPPTLVGPFHGLDVRVPVMEALSNDILAHANAIAAFRQATAPLEQLSKLAVPPEAFGVTNPSIFGPILTQSAALAGLADQMRRLTSPIAEVAELLRPNWGAVADLLPRVDDIVARSIPEIRAVNSYFVEQMQRPAAVPVVPGSPVKAWYDELDTAGAHLHEGTSSTVAAVNDLVESVREAGEEVAREVVERALSPYANVLKRLEILARPRAFKDLLSDFAKTFAREHWMAMWAEVGERFHSAPERVGKMVLGMYLDGVCLGTGFVGQELRTGDGFLDLLVNVLGLNHLVELKVIGGSAQGVAWAQSGVPQLGRYMEAYGLDESYLVVFDGRKTERGEQLSASYTVDGKVVHVIRVRVYFEIQ